MTDADIDEVAALTARVFSGGSEDAQAMLAFAYRACPFLRVDHGLVAVREDKIVGKWQALDLAVRVGATHVRAAGLHAVLVDPTIDGEGLAWAMVPRGFTELEKLGHDLAVGFVQKGAAYEAIGAKTVAADYEWSVDAWRMPKDDALTYLEASSEDARAIVDFSEHVQANRSASLVRTAESWPWIERKPPIVWLAEQGFVGLRSDASSVEVREAAGREPAFYRRALAAIGAFATARGVRTIRGHLPPDHPLVRASVDFGARIVADYPRRSGMMAAVLDAGSFMPKVKPELETRLARSVFADRRVKLTIVSSLFFETRSELHVASPTASQTGPKHELEVTIATTGGTLAQIVFGYRCPTRASGTDISSVGLGASEMEALLEALFPLGAPFLQHTDRW